MGMVDQVPIYTTPDTVFMAMDEANMDPVAGIARTPWVVSRTGENHFRGTKTGNSILHATRQRIRVPDGLLRGPKKLSQQLVGGGAAEDGVPQRQRRRRCYENEQKRRNSISGKVGRALGTVEATHHFVKTTRDFLKGAKRAVPSGDVVDSAILGGALTMPSTLRTSAEGGGPDPSFGVSAHQPTHAERPATDPNSYTGSRPDGADPGHRNGQRQPPHHRRPADRKNSGSPTVAALRTPEGGQLRIMAGRRSTTLAGRPHLQPQLHGMGQVGMTSVLQQWATWGTPIVNNLTQKTSDFSLPQVSQPLPEGMRASPALTHGGRTLRFRTNPNEFNWTHSLNKKEQTYGGRVIQPPSTKIDDFTIKVDCGGGRWPYANQVARFLRDVMIDQRKGVPATFEYTTRGGG